MPNPGVHGDESALTSTITENGDTHIPKVIRDFLNIDPGFHILWQINGDVVIVRPYEH